MPATDPRESVYRHRVESPVERELIATYASPGSRVLDIGTAATGRSALLLAKARCDVVSIEFNDAAIREFASSGADQRRIQLLTADMGALPFAPRSFDSVLIALQGLDYTTNPNDRAVALGGIASVLRDGGHLIFSASNTMGVLFSPSGWRSPSLRRLRARHVLAGRMFRRTFRDANGLELHQATPRGIIREVESSGPFEFVEASNGSGSSRNLAAITAMAAIPYYVFRRRST